MYYNYGLETEKENMIQIAKDLHYEKDVIKKLENAKSSVEMENIMIKARRDDGCKR